MMENISKKSYNKTNQGEKMIAYETRRLSRTLHEYTANEKIIKSIQDQLLEEQPLVYDAYYKNHRTGLTELGGDLIDEFVQWIFYCGTEARPFEENWASWHGDMLEELPYDR